MTTPILATKLYIPPPRPNVVRRPRLLERLNEELRHSKLTLISAPAGFGKTTLVSEWVADLTRPTAWLSLDAGDNDPIRFLAYLVAALRTMAPDIGAGILSALPSTQLPSPEVMLSSLLNELAALPAPCYVLVLDDYHLVDVDAVDQALAFLLEHLPMQLHVVIATREDPHLPLARLRAGGQLTELRATDLRFAPTEAAAFLNAETGLRLASEDIAALDARTEGWIAGLQLAALSLRGHQDPSAFVRAFAGDHRYIVDYLIGEVLARQPEDVRSFLLQTSILDRLSGPLCDAVTSQAGGAVRLAALERGNFFVVALDDQRHWYRFHRLFADVLQVRLLAEQSEQVPALHRRASAWYEQQGSAAEAIPHALAAGEAEDFAHAADLVELALPAVRQSRQEAALLGWLRALPDPLLRHRPVLSAFYAQALLASGELEGVEPRLQDAEQWLEARDAEEGAMAGTSAPRHSASAGMVVVDQQAFVRLPATIAVARAGQALARGDVATTVTAARRALDLAPEDDHLGRAGAAGFLGLAAWASGDLAAAYEAYAECMASVQRAGHVPDALGCAIALADIRHAQGHLRDAQRLYERGLQLAMEQGGQQGGQQAGPVPRGTPDMHVGLSALLCEHNDLLAATQHLVRSQELGEHVGLPQNPYRERVALAGIRVAQGDLDGALALLQEAERRYVGDFFPNVRPIAALVARLWVAQGRLGQALGWVRERGLSVDDELSYLREFEHVTLAHVLLARSRHDRENRRSLHEAMGLLDRLLTAAEAGERMGSVLDILGLQALAYQARGDLPAALSPLERALTLAEPEGYVRLFVDQGPPMAVLLEAAAKRGIATTYVRELLAAFGKAEEKPPAEQHLLDPLSDRELDVLRLLGSDLDGPEIARELTVSLNTVRTHTKNIYSKLGVNNRRAAVRRAEELGLLSRSRRH